MTNPRLYRPAVKAVVHNVPRSEIDALHDLYESTNGGSWNWHGENDRWNFTASTPCVGPWQGVTCSLVASAGYVHVLQLQLPGYNLAGFIPSSISNLTQLQVFDLMSNTLTGTIPGSVGLFPGLQKLYLNGNELGGAIPRSLGQLTVLKEFRVNNNHLTGSIPDSLGGLADLTRLYLFDNLLTGTLPSSFGQLVHLSELDCSTNHISGSIADSLGQLSQLLVLFMYRNHLTGTVPSILSQLPQLTQLNLAFNGFTGTIPDFLGQMDNLVGLALNTNQLHGPIPDNLKNLTKLRDLFLFGNHLTGTIPNNLGQLADLTSLFLVSNDLSGTVPASLAQCTNLLQLELTNNRLTGTIPEALGQLTGLLDLMLGYNQLTGTIPHSWGNLTRALSIYLYNNLLTGTVPGSLAACQGLTEFELGYNRLSGPVPDFMFQWSGVRFIHIQSNRFTGTLPQSALNGTASQLQVLLCDDNMLTGTLPESVPPELPTLQLGLSNNLFSGTIPSKLIAALRFVGLLFLDNNLLTGHIPQNWSAPAATMNYLYLYSNYLTGSIPASLGHMPLLQNLNLSSNRLTGTIPASFQFLASVQVLMLHNNQLRGNIASVFSPLQTNLSTVQLSRNQLTGTLPAAAFLLPSLSSFAAVDNCFEGPLPAETICSSPSLSALVLDGLHSASSCKRGASLSHHAFKLGAVPQCLLSMTNLATLHLSGSGLTGSLPTEANVSAVLTDLSLSHNLLTGEIPASILERDWNKLDLSYNRLAGTLHSARDAPYSNASEVHLQHNRLSDVIPGSMQRVGSLYLVENNLFSCRMDRSDVPQQDPGSDKYTCGSDAVNNALYTWLGVALAIGVIAGVTAYSNQVAERLCGWFGSVRNGKLRNLSDLFGAAHTLSILGVGSAAYCIMVLLPVYAAVSSYYPTFSYKYAWTVSGVFLTGTTAFVLEIVFMLLQLPICAYVAEWLLLRSSSPLLPGGDAVDAHATTRRSESRTRYTLAVAAVVLFSLAVVTGINVGFVIATLSLDGRKLTAVQVLLAAFKVGFNNIVVPALENRVRLLGTGHGFSISQLLLVLLNVIVIPCLVVMVISPACFYDALKGTDAVTSSFEYSGDCLSFKVVTSPLTGSQTLMCAGAQTAVDSTTYTPPFTYSYQCSSSFVTYYAPTYVIMCIISGFVVPAFHLLLLWLRSYLSHPSRLYSMVTLAIPRILREISSPQDLAQARGGLLRRSVFDANKFLVSQFAHLTLLLTFGVLFPPLAVCCAVAMASAVLAARLEVGRYVSVAVAANRQDCLDAVESACAGVATPRRLRTALYVVLTLSCMFYTLFLFDTLGYEVGFAGAFWVLIVVPLLPVVAWALYTAVGGLSKAASNGDKSEHVPDPELGVALADIRAMNAVGAAAEAAAGESAKGVPQPPELFSASPMHTL
jgi:Leucine-rich repeat (LRR) protein